MDNDSDSRPPSALQQLRSLLAWWINAEEVLTRAGCDLPEAYRFALATYEQLDAQADPTSPPWPALKRQLRDRLEHLIEVIRTHQPGHPQLPDMVRSRAAWCALPSQLHTCHSKSPVPAARCGDPTFFGLSEDRLLRLHAASHLEPLPHEFAASFLYFLAGLHYALRMLQSTGRPPAHSESDPIHGLSLEALADAVGFAMQSESQALVRATVRLPADTAYHCLFMGVAFVQENPSPARQAWLRLGRPKERCHRLFLAMGIKSAEASSAGRLIRSLGPRLVDLTREHLGPRLGDLLEQFV